jgi:hypothetical protein
LWRWVCSWARSMRRPSDLGFNDGEFKLPPLNVFQHVVKARKPREGFLFDIPAVGLKEQRSDLSNTLNERCEMAAEIINNKNEFCVSWCNLNKEGDLLTKLINDSVQVSGSDSEEHKEEAFRGFINRDFRVLVTKPKIGGFGLNLQHCSSQTYFASHSYEQYYQSVRRSWRFGQKNPVTIDMITTDGQENVLANLNRKSEQAEKMFDNLVLFMFDELKIQKKNLYTKEIVLPNWM